MEFFGKNKKGLENVTEEENSFIMSETALGIKKKRVIMGLGQCSAAIHCSYILAYKNSKVSRGDLVFVEEREQMHSCSTSDHRGVA